MNTIISFRIVIVNIFFIFLLFFQISDFSAVQGLKKCTAPNLFLIYVAIKKEGCKAAAHCLPLLFVL